MTTGSTVIPCLRYRNAAAAIEWLCETFGFEKGLVVPGDGDEIAHAQLTRGEGMVMLGSATDTEFGRLMKQPDEIGGAETQTAYVEPSFSRIFLQEAQTDSRPSWSLRGRRGQRASMTGAHTIDAIAKSVASPEAVYVDRRPALGSTRDHHACWQAVRARVAK